MSDKPVVVSGVKVDLAPDDLNDIEVLELTADIQDGETAKLITLMKRLFGDEKYKEVKEKLRGEDGRTTITAVSEWFNEVCEKVGAKN